MINNLFIIYIMKCFNLDQLISLAKGYNTYFDPYKPKIIIKADRKYLISEATKKLTNLNAGQICWLKQKFIDTVPDKNTCTIYKGGANTKDTLLPLGPSGPNEWLSNFDIQDALDMYKIHYPHFKFFGAVPMDFDDWQEYHIKDANFEELEQQGISQCGFIFNLDFKHQSGSHWVSLFACFKKGVVLYFDSVGTSAPERVMRLVNRLLNYMKTKGINGSFHYNKKQHQQGGTECGVYAIIFLLRLVKGDNFSEISEIRMDDNTINQCRDLLFQSGPNVPKDQNKCSRLMPNILKKK